MESTAQDKPSILPLRETIRRQVLDAFEAAGRDAGEAAKLLGISKATMYAKLKRYRKQ